MKFIGISGYPISKNTGAINDLIDYLHREKIPYTVGRIKDYTKGILPVNDDNIIIVCPDVYDYKDAEFLTKHEDDLLICVNNDDQIFLDIDEKISAATLFPDIEKIRSLSRVHDGSYITSENNSKNESEIGNLSAALIYAVRNKYLVDHA
jgi:nitrogenase molybdenum-iron protein alpha/beta subunit